MRRVRAALLAATLAPGCGGGSPIRDEEIAIHVSAGASEVELGKAFPLTVVRVWSTDLVPDEWSDRALAPLQVRLESTTRREDARHVEETLRFAGYAFSLDEIVVAKPTFSATPKNGGPARTAAADDIHVRVKPALARETPGPAELPGEPLPEPFPWLRWPATGAAALIALALVWWRLGRRAAESTMAAKEPTPPPHVRAQQRLLRLRESEPRTPAEIEAYTIEASNLVRDYIEERFAVRAPEMTTEEFLASATAARALESEHRALLSEFLAHCDLVKFARYTPTAADRAQLVASAERFLRETSAAEEVASEAGATNGTAT
ncbi:MAG: hypothetical protein HYR85_17855 [Planctomycetes bacterium]|nr:hypothetical protein [Planctomycetota bacterium]